MSWVVVQHFDSIWKYHQTW